MDKKNNFETEIDFKALPKSPSRLFGWIFPYYTVLFVVVGIYFIKHMDNANFNTVPAIYTDSLEINANVEIKKGGIMPAVDLGIISNPTDEIIKNGKTLFVSNCSSCHGNEGKGDGVAAVALTPPPRNFHNIEGWTKGIDISNMYTTIQKGISGTGMIGYDFISVEDKIAMIHYIRTMAQYPEVTEAQVSELDKTYELSKGINSPNNISLEMSIEKISNENSDLTSNVETLISNISSVNTESEIELFNKYVQDKNKVITIFKRDFTGEKESSGFINRVISFPKECGFKQSINTLSEEDLNIIFKILSNAIS